MHFPMSLLYKTNYMKIEFEFVKVNQVSQGARLLYYFYLLSLNNKNKSEQNLWEELVNKYIQFGEKNSSYSEVDLTIDLEAFQIVYSAISGKIEEVEEKTLSKIVCHIKSLLERVTKKERDVFDKYNLLAEQHPIVTRAIIVVLSGILTGLLSSCIYEGIKSSREDVNEIYVLDDSTQTAIHIYKKEDGSIIIEKEE